MKYQKNESAFAAMIGVLTSGHRTVVFATLLLVLIFNVSTHAQNIVKFEYFVDTDPGVGLATAVNVTPGTSFVDFNIPVSTSALTPGFHTLFVRSQNELGQWTHTHFRTFFVDNSVIPPTISSFNPSSGLVGSTVVITGTNFSTVAANNTVRFNGVVATVTNATSTSLTVTVPTGATSGMISVVVAGLTATSSSAFTVQSPNLTNLEYFFNTDPGPGSGTPITFTPGSNIDLTNINITTTGLPVGWHTLCVRSRDANNVWGFYECRRIYIREPGSGGGTPPPSPIAAVEFFYNADPGPGNGTAISITLGETVDVANRDLPTTLPVGWHTLSVRARNNDNVWGFYESRRIYVREGPAGPPPPASPIVALEWFVDTDPGVGQSSLTKAINPPESGTLDLVDEALSVGTVPQGARKIGVRAQNAAGQWSMTELRDFTVTPPCAIITPPTAHNQTRCDNGTLTLTASGAISGQTYRWYPDNTTLTALFQGNPFVTPVLSANTPYFVSVFDPVTFCESTRTQVSAIVTGIPKPMLNLTGALGACEDNTVTLIGPTGFSTYTWRNGVTDLGLNTNQITLNASGVYTLTVGNGACTSPLSDVFNFTINARPAKPVVSGTNGGSLCTTGSVTLSAPAGFAAYAWNTGATTQPLTVTAAGNYTVRVTDANGCQSDLSDPFVVSTSPPAKPTITVTGSTAICGSGSVLLEAPAGFTNYAWSNGATTPSTTVTTAGFYSVVVSQGSCPSPASDAVTVTSASIPAQPVITPLGATSICVGNFVILQAPSASQYLWSTGEITRQIVVSTSETITVQIGNLPTCLSVASAPVSVTQTGILCNAPSASGVSRCGAGSVTLAAAGAVGAQTYRWYNAPTGGTLLSTSNPYSPTVSATTVFHVALFEGGAESARTPVTATVNEIATPAIAGPAAVSICSGTSSNLTAPDGFVTYTWRREGTIVGNTRVLPVATSGAYTVEVGNGLCTSPASLPVTVSVVQSVTKPTVEIVSGDLVLCGGGTVELGVSGTFASYVWSPGGATTPTITVNAAGNYSVVVGNGTCTSPASDAVSVVSVVQPAQPVISITGSTTLCIGAFVVLTAPAGFNHYKWSNNETTRQIVVNAAGTYFVQTGNAATCLSTPSGLVTITESGLACGGAAAPDANFITNVVCEGQSTVFSDLSSNLGSNPTYAWDFDGNGTADSNTVGNVTNTYPASGSFNVTLSITLSGGLVITRTRTVVVNALPQPQFTAAPVCVGQATTFTNNSTQATGASYTWDFTNDGVPDDATAGNTAFTYGAAGSYSATLRLVSPEGCSNQRTGSVSVGRAPFIPLLEIDGGQSPQLCSGGSVLLKATPEAGVTYQWRRNGANVGANLPELTVNTAGLYSLTLTNTCGTVNGLNTVTTVVLPSPVATTITAAGSTALCAGESVLLSIPFTAGIQYQWKRDGNAIADATSNFLLASDAGSYVVVTNNTCGTADSDTRVVTQLPPPPLVPLITSSGSLTLCAGGSVDLSVTPQTGVSYTWRRNGIELTLDQNSISVSTAGVYTLVVANACRSAQSSNALQVIVNQPPLAQLISASRNPVLCPGESVTLAVTPEAGVTYRWLRDDNLLTAADAQLIAQDPGIYKLELQNSCGTVITSNTITVSQIAAPAVPEITAGGTTVICETETVALSIAAQAGVTYQWLRNEVVIPFTNSNTLVASQAGSYSATVGNGCTVVASSNAVNVTLNPRAPVAQSIQVLTGNLTFCAPGQVELGVPQDPNVSTYRWTVNGTPVGTNSPTLIASVGGTYQVVLQNDCRSVNSLNSLDVVVQQIPLPQNLSASRSTDLCAGQTVGLSVPTESNVSYQWLRNGSPIPATTNAELVTSEAGSYQLRMTNGCGPRLSDIRLITVLGPPSDTLITASGPTSFCPGGNVILRAPFVAGQTYQWKRNDAALANTFELLVRQSGVYTVAIANRCFTDSTLTPVTVREFDNPAPPRINSVVNNACDQRVYRLTAEGNFVSHQWFLGNSRVVGTNAAVYNAVTSGAYKVRGTDVNGCTADSEPVAIEIQEPQRLSIESRGDPDSLLIASRVAAAYQWFVNNKFIVGATERQLPVFYNGVYKVRVTWEDGCRFTSDSYTLNEESYNKFGRLATFPTDSTIMLPERKFIDLVEVSPNPARTRLQVSYFGSATEGTTCTLYNGTGVEVLATEMAKTDGYLQASFDLAKLEPGLYLVRIRNRFVVLTRKMIKL